MLLLLFKVLLGLYLLRWINGGGGDVGAGGTGRPVTNTEVAILQSMDTGGIKSVIILLLLV